MARHYYTPSPEAAKEQAPKQHARPGSTCDHCGQITGFVLSAHHSSSQGEGHSTPADVDICIDCLKKKLSAK